MVKRMIELNLREKIMSYKLLLIISLIMAIYGLGYDDGNKNKISNLLTLIFLIIIFTTIIFVQNEI